MGEWGRRREGREDEMRGCDVAQSEWTDSYFIFFFWRKNKIEGKWKEGLGWVGLGWFGNWGVGGGKERKVLVGISWWVWWSVVAVASPFSFCQSQVHVAVPVRERERERESLPLLHGPCHQQNKHYGWLIVSWLLFIIFPPKYNG